MTDTPDDVARIAPLGEFSDRAVYLGDGVWWQLTHRQLTRGVGDGFPMKIRPVRWTEGGRW